MGGMLGTTTQEAAASRIFKIEWIGLCKIAHFAEEDITASKTVSYTTHLNPRGGDGRVGALSRSIMTCGKNDARH